ncbi:calcium/proton exchanger [Dactylosporangium sp. NPDC000244]|uniref:calcium/proton exchanger n=1 Tax=Dactylosporangium sp. NPDC000244 TaxID=3154365 RepID=UPI003320BE95
MTVERVFVRSDFTIFGICAVSVGLAAVTRYTGVSSVLAFVVAGAAVAALASLVGRSVEQLGDRFGPGATGVLQGALGNLPELFIGFFALKAGLVSVVQSAIIGSILSNILLVLGLSFVAGGLKHGTQKFNSERARTTMVLMVLATGALVLPSLASYVHTPAEPHEKTLSIFVAIILLLVFALSLPASLKRGAAAGADVHMEPPRWPIWLAVALLAVASGCAALVSDWFVYALEPAIDALGISQAFAGLVIVAIAGNAIENVIGIKLAYKNQSDYALSVIINSPLQIALVLAPALVLLSLLTATTLTLVFAPMLIMAVAITVIAVAFIVFDGESTWLEGATLVALYCIIAAVFWWG